MKPRPNWTNIPLLLLGIALIILGFRHGMMGTMLIGAAAAAGGGGLLYRQKWAYPVAVGALGALVVVLGFKLITLRFNWWRAFSLGCMGYYIWEVIKEANSLGASGKRALISLVQLLRAPNHFLTARKLAAAAERAWGVPFKTSEDGEGQYFVVGKGIMFIASAPGITLMIHNVPSPYFDDSAKAAEDLIELRRKHAVENHVAWLSIDFMGWHDTTKQPADAYPVMAKFMAELLDEDGTALYCPETRWMAPFEPGMAERLRGPAPLEVFRKQSLAPVIRVEDDDPRMHAAVAEARRRWPEFLDAFANRAGEDFSIKAPITVDERTEFIWIGLERVDGDKLHGTLGNDPVALGSLKNGDPVTVEVTKVNDWVFVQGEEMKGGFTMKLIAEISTEPKRKSDTGSLVTHTLI